jgi:hypothetical protein
MSDRRTSAAELPPFSRATSAASRAMMQIGTGEIGGKARGLVAAREVLARVFPEGHCDGVVVDIPRFVVISTDVFDRFMQLNDLDAVAHSDVSDDRKAHQFQHADLPPEIVGDLRALTDSVRLPLAIRSSSQLEDALEQPFAGVYETKMTPNNQPDPSARFRKVLEAIKFVYATTFYSAARSYRLAFGRDVRDEKMAVIIQEVMGHRRGTRYYPTLSGVVRSYNFYPGKRMCPQDGVVNLALGLGKSIVDGGLTWTYCPARPKLPSPFASVADMIVNTQTKFWAVNLGRPSAFDPIRETEYLLQLNLDDADYDNVLTHIASTYLAESDRLVPGASIQGPRVVDFAPLLDLRVFPINDIVVRLLEACHESFAGPVEIEFAATLPVRDQNVSPRLGVLQVRPMLVPGDEIDVCAEAVNDPTTIIHSMGAMGNGRSESIYDIVYVKRDTFETKHTIRIALELESYNTLLVEEGRPYLLIGFGRWGSSDRWLGIPVQWGQISGAKAIVEASLPNMIVEPSQGSHFFHNLSAFRVCYFTVPHHASCAIQWDRLDAHPAVRETEYVRHVRLARPLSVAVDGRTGRGVIQLRDGN